MTKPKAYKHKIKKIGDLIPYVNNSRTHDENQVNQIASSIKEFGFTNPILIDTDGGVIAGHGRILAAKKLNYTDIPCIVLDGLTKAQKKAYVIADNQLALNAGWDLDLLKIELEDLNELEFDIDLLGFDDDFIDGLLQEEAEGLTDEDEVPEPPETPVSVLGDIWQLGNHRLMCGSCTDPESVKLLMDGDMADIAFTSPPYNAGKTPKESGKYKNDTDNKSKDDYVQFLNEFTLLALEYSDFVFSNIQSISGNKIALIDHLYMLKEKYADVIIWNKGKGQPAMARKVLNSAFEYIYVFSNEATRAIGKKDFRGTIPNIFELSPNAGKEFAKIHKATFRVELPEMFIDWFVESSVYEPFNGTGTTLIACEKRNKKGFGMELDPAYIDVTIKRWESFTGQKATHTASGKSYIELSEERI